MSGPYAIGSLVCLFIGIGIPNTYFQGACIALLIVAAIEQLGFGR